MKLAVAIPSSGRVEYLDQCLASLERNSGIDKLILCPERGVGRPVAGIDYWPEPERLLYVNAGTIAARNYAFNSTDCDLVLTMDDDVVVAPRFIKVLLAAYDWIVRTTGTHHIVQSAITYPWPTESKEYMAGAICHGFNTGCNTLMHRTTWRKVSYWLKPYANKFATKPSEMNHDAIRSWFKAIQRLAPRLPGDKAELYLCGACGVGCDAALQLAANAKYIPTTHLFVNRAVTVGEHGANTTPASFGSLRHQILTPLAADESPLNFFWHPYQP